MDPKTGFQKLSSAITQFEPLAVPRPKPSRVVEPAKEERRQKAAEHMRALPDDKAALADAMPPNPEVLRLRDEIDRLRFQHDDELEKMEGQLRQEFASRVASQWQSNIDHAFRAIEAEVLRVLVPIAEKHRNQARIERMVSALAEDLKESMNNALALEAPSDLVDALQSACRSAGFDVAVRSREAAHVALHVDDTVFHCVADPWQVQLSQLLVER